MGKHDFGTAQTFLVFHFARRSADLFFHQRPQIPCGNSVFLCDFGKSLAAGSAFEYLAKTEGIIPAIESAHAVAHAMKLAPEMEKDRIMVITISGRGDKDCAAIARYRGENINE